MGRPTDRVTTLNAPYAKTLVDLRASGYSEKYLQAHFANEVLFDMNETLRGPFLADLKRREVARFLPSMYRELRYDATARTLHDLYAELRTAYIPRTLVGLDAALRVESIPEVIERIYIDLRKLTVPTVLRTEYNKIRIASTARVLRSVHQDLRRDAVPDHLKLSMDTQRVRSLPAHLRNKRAAFEAEMLPTVLDDMFTEVCGRYTRQILGALYMNYAIDYADGLSIQQVVPSIWDQWRLGLTPIDLDNMAPRGLQVRPPSRPALRRHAPATCRHTPTTVSVTHRARRRRHARSSTFRPKTAIRSDRRGSASSSTRSRCRASLSPAPPRASCGTKRKSIRFSTLRASGCGSTRRVAMGRLKRRS